jgi:hypothetical protein
VAETKLSERLTFTSRGFRLVPGALDNPVSAGVSKTVQDNLS